MKNSRLRFLVRPWTSYSTASRIPPGRFIGLFAVGCRVACVLRLSVRSLLRSRRLLVYNSGAWGSPESLLDSSGGLWAPYWEVWGSLGLHFGSSGASWAPFLELWGCLGCLMEILGGSRDRPGGPRPIFHSFSWSFWHHLGTILEVKIH